jgi:hypothetical protein
MSSESGKSFGLSFIAFFCLLFGGGLFYEEAKSSLTAAVLNQKSILGLMMNPYVVLGVMLFVLGVICAVLAIVMSRRARMIASKPSIKS